MGHDKLRKFAENETFACLLQPDCQPLLKDGYARLASHPIKGQWRGTMFPSSLPSSPLVLELGCGKGEYTVDLALRRPEANYVGVDIKGARLWKGAKYVTEHSIPNAAFLRTKVEFITAFFAPSEVSEIWLTFSDTQFKSENSRLSSPVFLERYRAFLAPGGKVHLKTDSRFLHEYTKAVCKVNSLPVLCCTEDLYSPEGLAAASGVVGAEVYEVQTFYESMFRAQGYNINYLCFALDHDGDFVHPSEEDFDAQYWRSREGARLLFGRDSAETRRQKLHSKQ